MQNLTIWLNRMVKGIMATSCVISLQLAKAQEAPKLSLTEAYDLALKNYPLIKQRELVKQTAEINIDNLSKGYLPQFAINGQSTFQSEVTKVTLPTAGVTIQPLSRDQYKIITEANQLLYDGGNIKQRKQLQELNADTEQQGIEVELYKIKERINQVFFGILYLDDQRIQAELVKQDIQSGIKRVSAQVQNGTAFRSNIDLLNAESLKTDQRIIDLTATRKGYLEALGLFLNRPLPENTQLEKPMLNNFVADDLIARPELKLFSSQVKLADHQRKLIQSKNLPTAGFFVQGGYGKPALNLLKNEFDFFYVGGLRLSWSLGGFYTKKKELQLVEVNKQMVDVKKETFLLNTNTQLKQQKAEVDKMQQLVTTDDRIVELLTRVKEASKAQLENGVITTIDYLQTVNQEDQSRQTKLTHQLQLLKAQVDYQTISGKQ